MMSFMIILLLVIIALIILSILFAVFKFMIGLLPAAIIVALIFWIIYQYDQNKKKEVNSTPSAKEKSSTHTHSSDKSNRKPARDVEIKDVEDEDKDNG